MFSVYCSKAIWKVPMLLKAENRQDQVVNPFPTTTDIVGSATIASLPLPTISAVRQWDFHSYESWHGPN